MNVDRNRPFTQVNSDIEFRRGRLPTASLESRLLFCCLDAGDSLPSGTIGWPRVSTANNDEYRSRPQALTSCVVSKGQDRGVTLSRATDMEDNVPPTAGQPVRPSEPSSEHGGQPAANAEGAARSTTAQHHERAALIAHRSTETTAEPR